MSKLIEIERMQNIVQLILENGRGIELIDVYVIEQMQVSGYNGKKPPSHQPKSVCLSAAEGKFVQFIRMKLWCEMTHRMGQIQSLRLQLSSFFA